MAAAAPATPGKGKFETRAWRELPHHGDSMPEEAEVLSLSPKDGEALSKKHAFHPEIPSASLKKKISIFCFLVLFGYSLKLNTFLRKGSEI